MRVGIRRLTALMTVAAALATAAGCTAAADGASSGDGGSDGRTTGGGGSTESSSAISAPGVDSVVELRGPAETGAGSIPTFEWSAVDGAGAYRLVVKDAQGNATWAWEGTDTAIALGAVPDREEGDGGPILTEGSFWSVVALDGEGHVVAVSELRPVSP